MTASVKLKELIDEMQSQMEEWTIYFNKKTGELVAISDEEFRAAEEDDDEDKGSFDMDEDRVQMAMEILEDSDDYVELPSEFDIHEYDIMERFCLSVKNDKDRKVLLIAIKGSGAFRRFKDMVCELGMEEDWYRFKDEEYKVKAIEWCIENGIRYVE
jgi:hypothetical protein